MNTSFTYQRALVLGGGGSTGNAWLIGVVAGLAEAGLDVTSADLTVGTSAGATAAFQVTNTSPADLYTGALTAVPAWQAGPGGQPGAPRPASASAPSGTARPVEEQLARVRAVIDSARDAADMRRRMGAAALELDAASDGSWSVRWRETVAARLPGAQWPDRDVLVTAVDARTGEQAVFDRGSGVDVVDAVAASTSSRLPYRIADRLFLDGGYRRSENADLAAGSARVLVLAPLGGRTLHPLAWGMQLATQVDELRAAGSTVTTVVPRAEDEHLFGVNGMDLSLRPAAARAGHGQGLALAARLGPAWG